MKKNLFTLGSIVLHGVGGASAGAINFIYSFFLEKHHLDYYRHIHVNQIGDDLNEFIMKERKSISINIRYPVIEDFEFKSEREQNIIRLDVINEAMLRLAEYDTKINKQRLYEIKSEILAKDFSFEIVYKTFVYSKQKGLSAKVIIKPQIDRFDIYLLIEDAEILRAKELIYSGLPSDFYFDDLFYFGKWNSVNEFTIKGKQSQFQYHILVDKLTIELIKIAPDIGEKYIVYEMMKAFAYKNMSIQDYVHAINPNIVIRNQGNLN